MKIGHCADVHIRNLKYHSEYRYCFRQMYDLLRKEDVDCIVVAGDLAHTKTQISPEFVDLCGDFLQNLADIAPSYVILGNHDFSCQNSSRQDAISPIANALNHKKLHILKDSGQYPIGGKFVLNVLSISDKENWIQPTDSNLINIALYHGPIRGCKTDTDWVMDYAEYDVSMFDNFDFAFLGDIHRTNQILDNEGRKRYPGSLVQQNFGESNDKGFLIWDIKDKNDFSVKHFKLENPKPFISMNLTKDGQISGGILKEIPVGSRIRLISDHNLTPDRIRKSIDAAKRQFSTESVTFLSRAENKHGSVDNLIDSFRKEDLRSVDIQEKLICEYLKDYNVDDDLMRDVLKLNIKYDNIVQLDSESVRNVDFEILELEWDNLFNYGERNKIKFENLSGVVGIFGKAFSGKSSAIDSLLFTIYNSIGKNNPGGKTINMINRDKDECRGFAKLRIGNKIYSIERKAEKYLKKLHNNETIEAKMTLDFEEYDLITKKTRNLNGERRQDTDKNIAKLFGTAEDFMTTSMSSQFGTLSFIDAKSTKRKEIFAKFLDLEPFEKKYKLANEDSKDLRGILKKLEDTDFDSIIEKTREELIINESFTKSQKQRCNSIKQEIVSLRDEIGCLNKNIEMAPTEYIDIKLVSSELVKKNSKLDKKSSVLLTTRRNFEERKERKGKISEFIKNFDLDSLTEKGKIISDQEEKLQIAVKEIEEITKQMETSQKRFKILNDVPCGDEYPKCPFIQNAHEVKKNSKQLEELKESKEKEEKELTLEILQLEPKKVTEELQKYHMVHDKIKEMESDIILQKTSIEKEETELKLLISEIEKLQEKEEKYNQNKEVIEDIEAVIQSRDKLKEKLVEQKKEIEVCENEVNTLFKAHGSLEQKLSRFEQDKKELEKTRKDYEAYELYLKCMHSGGIAYDIVKRSLPAINNELSKILADIIDMEVYFENEDNRLNIYFRNVNGSGSIPLELGSGTQKSLAAMAIRLALVNVSSLPKGNVFILDEPGTMLDGDNMEGFIRILEIVKSLYKCIILISHLDPLKDQANMIINIEEKNGFASINV